MVVHDRTRMTAAEFWQLTETSDQRFELIDGEVIEMATPIPDHQDVVLESALFLRQIAKAQGGKVCVAPLEVYLDEHNIPQPDVMWLAPKSQCVVSEKRLVGPPDLIVEVFSPGTRQHDKVTKFRIYQKYGVREYWMIDPAEQFLEVWRLVEGQFAFQGVFVPGETFTSAVLGDYSVQVNELFGL
jgi:Uma2 family endonuclease